MTARIKPRPEVYTRVTAKVIADFEQGVRSWQKPWNSKYTAGASRAAWPKSRGPPVCCITKFTQ